MDEAVLEYLLSMPDHELCIMGNWNVREMFVISAWYLWQQSQKLVHKETIQNAHQISMGIRALTTTFITASSPKVFMKKMGMVLPSGRVG